MYKDKLVLLAVSRILLVYFLLLQKSTVNNGDQKADGIDCYFKVVKLTVGNCCNQTICKLTLATALSEMKPAARLPNRPPTSRALMYELPMKKNIVIHME